MEASPHPKKQKYKHFKSYFNKSTSKVLSTDEGNDTKSTDQQMDQHIKIIKEQSTN